MRETSIRSSTSSLSWRDWLAMIREELVLASMQVDQVFRLLTRLHLQQLALGDVAVDDGGHRAIAMRHERAVGPEHAVRAAEHLVRVARVGTPSPEPGGVLVELLHHPGGVDGVHRHRAQVEERSEVVIHVTPISDACVVGVKVSQAGRLS